MSEYDIPFASRDDEGSARAVRGTTGGSLVTVDASIPRYYGRTTEGLPDINGFYATGALKVYASFPFSSGRGKMACGDGFFLVSRSQRDIDVRRSDLSLKEALKVKDPVHSIVYHGDGLFWVIMSKYISQIDARKGEIVTDGEFGDDGYIEIAPNGGDDQVEASGRTSVGTIYKDNLYLPAQNRVLQINKNGNVEREYPLIKGDLDASLTGDNLDTGEDGMDSAGTPSAEMLTGKEYFVAYGNGYAFKFDLNKNEVQAQVKFDEGIECLWLIEADYNGDVAGLDRRGNLYKIYKGTSKFKDSEKTEDGIIEATKTYTNTKYWIFGAKSAFDLSAYVLSQGGSIAQIELDGRTNWRVDFRNPYTQGDVGIGELRHTESGLLMFSVNNVAYIASDELVIPGYRQG